MFGALRARIKYFIQHRFVRSLAILQVGTILSTLIQATAGIVMARLLRPEQFGIYALAFSLASIASLFLGTGIQDSVTPILSRAWVRQDRHELQEVLGFWIKMILLTAIFTLCISSALPWIARYFYNNGEIGWFALIIVAGAIVSTLMFAFSSIALQVAGHIKVFAALSFSDAAIRYVLSILLVVSGFGVIGAMAGHFFGALIVAAIATIIWIFLQRRHKLLPSLSKLLRLGRTASLRKYIGPGFLVSMDRNIAVLFMSLPVALTGAFVAITEVTFFKLAFGYINLALSLLGPLSVLLNVEFPKIQVMQSERLASYFVRVSLYAMGLSAVITAGAILTSPILFRILYGISFLPSVPYVFGLFLYGALFGIGVGLGPMWRAINKVKVSIFINILTLLIGIPLGILLIKEFQVWGAIAMVTLWYTTSHLISFFYLSRKLRMLESTADSM
jgi:lipopolysaccharide exporter